MNVFLAGNVATTGRDLASSNRIGFTWQKSLFQWRQIEGEAGLRLARLRPRWRRRLRREDHRPPRLPAALGAPGSRQQRAARRVRRHYADFVRVFVDRYPATAARHRPRRRDLERAEHRPRGGARIDAKQAADYVRLLELAYKAAKAADPTVTVVSAALADLHGRREGQARRRLPAVDLRRRRALLRRPGRPRAGLRQAARRLAGRVGRQHNGCRVFTFRRVETCAP